MMLLNTFAPPFKLVGGYFIVGILFLLMSVFVFFMADFTTITSLNTAGFMHIYFVGFVMSIIIGALYQLTSVILEKSFFSIKGAFVNLFIYALGVAVMSAGMISGKIWLMHSGGLLLFLSLLFFDVTYLLSFIGNTKRSLAAFLLLVSAVFLLIGLVLGFCLLMIFSGVLSLDFAMTLKFHIYFVVGFVFFIIVGVSTVLLPMFALAHDLKFTLSKLAFGFYILAGALLVFNDTTAFVAFALAVFSFVAEALKILKKRVRKALDYWSVNIFLSLIALIVFCVFYALRLEDTALFCLLYGFLYSFIVAHLYKIAPFLIWYHYVAPFVGKTKVPLLDDMIVKSPTYIAIAFNALGLVLYVFGMAYAGLGAILVSVVLVTYNIINVFKFIKFGVKNER
ncbi:peptidase M50 [Campylobacter anatolicus]|uniref:peptidase M50 n=1 Tax=Campylobacter anatolicus TaxID=2829105 RepID=UPI001E463028|nr:peptidase M50 [Campylobacter anatolicus]